ncbi:NAD-dependent epimerase/dehydratase family protein [Candidatus Thiosymbion oneisti]|nr:NAD(P)-dependent oxidoreductase [Candidatus Thiosymbion oneisti]
MIIVVGGNGFVGSGFVRHFKSCGAPTTVIGRDNYADHIGAECDILINANGNSMKFLAKDDPKGEFQASVVSVRNSLIDFTFKKYIYLSTSDVYPDCSSTAVTQEDLRLDYASQSPYGFHKHLAELCVQHTAKDWLIIRQGGFVGKGMKKNAVFDVLYGDRIWVHPESRFQFINTDDSARLVMELVERGLSNQVFNLTATGTISVREVMGLSGRTVPYDGGVKPLRYEISTEKVSRYVGLPKTGETVRSYLSGESER